MNVQRDSFVLIDVQILYRFNQVKFFSSRVSSSLAIIIKLTKEFNYNKIYYGRGLIEYHIRKEKNVINEIISNIKVS